MNIAVPSRFSCLSLEGDDFVQSKKAEKKTANKQNVRKEEKSGGNSKKPVGKQPKKEKKTKLASDKQWQEWKEKDEAFVNGHFEQDIQNAIMLSKLDLEEKKEVYSKIRKEAEDGKKPDKKKKNKPMSLEQFLGSNQDKHNGKVNSDELSRLEKPGKDEKFFENVELEAQGVLTKEKQTESRKLREANIEEVITIAQYQEKLEKERHKNVKLCEKLEKLRTQIAAVKARNKTLCGILGHGEMKEKADVLMELERLNNVKNELTDEVAKLHVLLEQERSKVAALTSESQKHKDKKHKKQT